MHMHPGLANDLGLLVGGAERACKGVRRRGAALRKRWLQASECSSAPYEVHLSWTDTISPIVTGPPSWSHWASSRIGRAARHGTAVKSLFPSTDRSFVGWPLDSSHPRF